MSFRLFTVVALITLAADAASAWAAPVVTLPSNYQIAYDFTPTAVSQIVQHGASANGSTISSTNWTQIPGSHDLPTNATIASIQGIEALQVAATDTQGLILSTLGEDFVGYSFAPPWYAECKQYFPTEGKGWDQVFMCFGQDTDSKWYEYDFPETWGNLGCGAKIVAEGTAINHQGVAGLLDYSSDPKVNTLPLPAGGTWNGAWHTFSCWVTEATGDPNNPGTANFYADGQLYRVMRAPTDPIIGVPYWNRKSFALWALTSSTENNSAPFNCATHNPPYTGYLAYIRIWTSRSNIPQPPQKLRIIPNKML